uniref:C2H2-type domain-containing protein n=1 Tax=Biomphalaria glabrata TaxID=6526 RepID=A0A2C9JGZ0_BIOGL
METRPANERNGDGNMNAITMGSVGMALPVTSGIDHSINAAISSGTVTGTISVPCSAGNGGQHHQSIQTQPQHIHIPGATMSIGSLAVAMGLSGTNSDPNNLTFTSNALANLSARMSMSSVAGTNAAGLMATGNSLVAFPGNTPLNLVPGVGMNIPGGGGVSIMDGSGLSMAVAGSLAMQAASNVNVVGVQTSNISNSNSLSSQQQGMLQNSVHISASGSSVGMMSSGGVSSSHSANCCGGCRTRVTVKDQSSQTDLSTVIQVKAEERLARSGLMPGARLISHSAGSTVSHATPNSHHGPNYPCSCDFCGRMFAKKEYLRRHVRIHTGERPYKCVICGHSFRRSHHLRCHELTHTGTKPYTCGICGKAFNLSHHLRRHEMTHTGEKPYACTECGKAFTRKQHLDRHYKTHTGEYHRTFKCPFCEKMFFRAHHRDKHMKRHGEVLTTPDLTAATFSPVNNMNLSIRADGTLRADGLTASPISVASKDESHSSEDYLTSDEEGKLANPNKPKEGSKKRKGTSPMRLRFPYDYNAKDGHEGMKIPNMDMGGMKNMTFPLPHGAAGPSHGLPAQSNTILTTPTRGRPRGSKNRGGASGRGKKKERALLMSQLGLEMKTERMEGDRDGYGGLKKEEEMGSGGVYAGKTIPNIPQQFVSESVVVRHPLQVGSPHGMGQQLGHDKGMVGKQEGSTPGPVPTSTPTPTPDGRGQLQWQQQQQVGMNQSGGGNTGEYMANLNRQLHTPTSGAGASNVGSGDVQQTMHYKPGTPDQALHHAWAGGNWPRLTLTSEPIPNSYNQVDASRFMNIYSASKVMEMRMADLRNPQGFDGGQWNNQGRRDQGQDKGDNRIYTMHQ